MECQDTICKKKRRIGFSILEILVVIAIIAILAGILAPEFLNTTKARRLSTSAAKMMDQLLASRSEAIAKNRRVLVRFFKTNGQFRAYQSYLFTGGTWLPLAKVTQIDDAVEIFPSVTYSTIPLSAPIGLSTDPVVPPAITVPVEEIRQFEFRPDGSTDLSPLGEWHVTLVYASRPVGSTLAGNFITLQVDPLRGGVQSFQP